MQNYLALSTADEVLFVFPCLCFFMPRRCRLWAASPALQWRRYVFTMSRCVSRAKLWLCTIDYSLNMFAL